MTLHVFKHLAREDLKDLLMSESQSTSLTLFCAYKRNIPSKIQMLITSENSLTHNVVHLMHRA